MTRSDDVELARHVGEVNKYLGSIATKEHSYITKRHLNRGGLHLNKVGTTHLAGSLIQCIQHGNK